MPELHRACARGDLDKVRSLVHGGSGGGDTDTTAPAELVNQASPLALGRTPLMEAAGAGHVVVVRWLLQHGANVNGVSRRKKGQTALHVASTMSHMQTVKVLLDAGA